MPYNNSHPLSLLLFWWKLVFFPKLVKVLNISSKCSFYASMQNISPNFVKYTKAH